jgi:DNA-binding NarL/FixJ family response regulator
VKGEVCELQAIVKLTIEAIPAAAFVASAGGKVTYTNEAARRMLAADRSRTTAQLNRALRGDEGAPFSVMHVTGSGKCAGQQHRLLVHRDEAQSVSARVSAAVSRWNISRRQAEVLALVIDGHGNASIATMLGIAVRTVEVHVSALFVRAEVENRSALVSRVLSR